MYFLRLLCWFGTDSALKNPSTINLDFEIDLGAFEARLERFGAPFWAPYGPLGASLAGSGRKTLVMDLRIWGDAWIAGWIWRMLEDPGGPLGRSGVVLEGSGTGF